MLLYSTEFTLQRRRSSNVGSQMSYGPEGQRQSNVTATIVDMLEARGVRSYAMKRTPWSVIVSFPNEPESTVQRHADEIRVRLDSTHRDIKPSNILLDPRDDHAIIIDLGRSGDEGTVRDEIVHILKAVESDLRAKGIEAMLLFGSAARDKPYPNDVDILVRLRPGVRWSAFDLAGVQRILEQKLGRRVDLSVESKSPPAFMAAAERDGVRIFGP